jgi:hypothetical protein
MRVAAVVTSEFDQQETARGNIDAAEFDPIDLRGCQLPWPEFRQPYSRRPYVGWIGFRRFGSRSTVFERARQLLLPHPVLLGIRKAHPLGAPERGVPRIAGGESGVNSLGDLRIGHPSGMIFPQRLRMLRRPTDLFQSLILASIGHPFLIYDIQKFESSLTSDNRNCYCFRNSERWQPCWTSS